MWFLPISLLVTATVLAIPLSRYFAWIMDGKYHPPRILRWFEARLDSGPQDWKQYATALLVFNVVLFVYGFIVLALQPVNPLNQQHKGMLAPTTIFNSVISFMTNTNIQHYAGEVHLSNFSQIFFIISNMFLSASVGLCALAAIIRAFRGETQVGNFFLDMWRVVIYMLVPAALISGVLFIQQGMPMTYRSQYQVSTLGTGSDGYHHGGPREATNDRCRSGGGSRTDQNAGDKRRRVLRHELRPSVRKSQRLDQLHHLSGHDAVPVRAGVDVRSNARPVTPCLGHLLGNVCTDVLRYRLVDLL